MYMFLACIVEQWILAAIGRGLGGRPVARIRWILWGCMALVYSMLSVWYYIPTFFGYVSITVILWVLLGGRSVIRALYIGLVSYALLIYLQALCLPWIPEALFTLGMDKVSLVVEIGVALITVLLWVLIRWRGVDIAYDSKPGWAKVVMSLVACGSLLFCMVFKPRLEAGYNLNLYPVLILEGILVLGTMFIFYESMRRRQMQTIQALRQETEAAKIRSHEYEKKLRMVENGDNVPLAQAFLEEEAQESAYWLLQPIVRRILDNYRRQCEVKGIEPRLCVTPIVPTYDWKETSLVSLLGNILENAIEAVESLEEERRWIELELGQEENSLWIQCRNPYEERGEIAEEALFRKGTSSKGEKRGRGLYIVDKLVKQAGGHVAAHREAGIFIIRVDL